ncbi:lipase 1-like isoform X2 [Drosophila innubila]|uniref:lipase 1-like isoform X2 n=1 Tax=Drosophila innubila TaxID=198719 RepID=UPI00148C709D|nr:lipase 1-like isoform X2 [Drosophila innubila]
MGSLLYSALLALGAVGVLAHRFEPRVICISKQKNLIRQQTYIQRQLTRFQYQVNSLRTNCQLTVPDILGLKPPTSPAPGPVGENRNPPNYPPGPTDTTYPYLLPPGPPKDPSTSNPPGDLGVSSRPSPDPGIPPVPGVPGVSGEGEPPEYPNGPFAPNPPGRNEVPPSVPGGGVPPGNPSGPFFTNPPGRNEVPPSVPGGGVPPQIYNPYGPQYVPGLWSPNIQIPSQIINMTIGTPMVVYPPTPSNGITTIRQTIISTTPIIEYYLTQKDVDEDARMTTVMLIKKYGYPVETHFVTTQDNYVLCLHRIPRPGGQVALLVHGLMSSSATWVQMGPSNGLAYKLYQQGYDVWLLNTRGNLYSKDHKNPNIKPTSYWQFSFHEIGIYDLPATIDMIITISKQPKIQYIGHSQGSTAFFVMCSELPHYAEKIILMQALSPTVFMQNTQSPVLRFLSLFKGKFGVLLNLLGGLEISRNNNLIAQFRNHICSANIGSQICAIFDYVMCGFGWTEFNTNLTQLVVGHSSQGASSVQIYHYAQLLSGPKFHRFDKGALLNQMVYKHSDPPSYNLTRCSCKVAVHYSEDDWLAGSRDVQMLTSRLPNIVDNSYIAQKGFSHYDYLLSRNVNRLVYGRVLSNCYSHKTTVTTQTQTQTQTQTFVLPLSYSYI